MGAEAGCAFCGGALLDVGDACWDRPDLPRRRCQQCDLVQLARFDHVDVEHYAADDYFPPDLAAWRAREWEWNRKRVQRLRELLPDASTRAVLDFGSGAGGFLQQAQGVFRELVGFDLSSRVCAAHQANGWRCVDRLDAVPPSIDTIVQFHVLEHLPRPWEHLRELRSRFPAARTFVIEVPNTDEALNALWQNEAYRRNHVSADHLWYFTSATLRRVVEAAGLEVRIDSQLQRYPLANNLGWLARGRGGGQDQWPFLNDARLNDEYERVLVAARLADSVFLVCEAADA